MSSEEHVGTVAELRRFPVKSMLGERLESVEVGARGLAGDRAWALVDDADGVVASAKRPARWARLLEARARFVDEPALDTPGPPVEIELPDGTTVRSEDPSVHSTLSHYVGRDVHLVSQAPEDRRFHEVWPDIEGLAPSGFIEGTRLDEPPSGEGGEETISEIGLAALAPAGTFFDVTTLHLLTTSTLDALRSIAPSGSFDARRYRPNVLVATDPAGFVENRWPGRTIVAGGVAMTGIMATMRCVMTTLAQDGLAADRTTLRTIAGHNRVEIPGLGTWACAGAYADVASPGVVAVGDPVSVGPAPSA